MALIDPPEVRRLRDFMAGLPHCPHGCPNEAVYESPSFRVPTPDDTIDDQVAEVIARYEREAAGQLRQHLAQEHQDTGAFLALLDDVSREARQWETTHRTWLDGAAAAVAAELTEELIPADMRAAGVRFEWAEGT